MTGGCAVGRTGGVFHHERGRESNPIDQKLRLIYFSPEGLARSRSYFLRGKIKLPGLPSPLSASSAYVSVLVTYVLFIISQSFPSQVII